MWAVPVYARPDPDIKEYQSLLKQAGYYPGPIDGIRGPLTEKAILRFQKDQGLTADGVVGPVTLQQLRWVVSTYTVRRGDTLSRISQRFGVSVEWLVKQNRLRHPDLLHPGQKLVVKPLKGTVTPDRPVAAQPPPSTPPSPPAAAPEEPVWEHFLPGAVTVSSPAGLAGARVALTFNDAPDPLYTPEILEVLSRHGVKATFFLIGERIRAAAEVTKSLASAHEVGNHSYAHRPLLGQPSAEIEKDLEAAQTAIRAVTGQVPVHFRPPGGGLDGAIAAAAHQQGLRIVFWDNVGATDDIPLAPEDLAARIASRCRDGSILMLHADRPQTPVVVEKLLAALQGAGVRLVPLSQLVK